MKKPIPFNPRYLVSDEGEVFSGERKLKPNNNGLGYLSVKLYRNNVAKRFYVHRLVAEAVIQNPQRLPVVNHIDANPANNASSNLEWVDQKTNIAHSRKLGHQNKDRPVRATNLENGEAVVFGNLREAEKALLSGGDILRKCVRRKGLTFEHRGYLWEVLK